MELTAVLGADPPKNATVVEDTYGVFNDPEFFDPKFDSGEIHPALREKILEEPLWASTVAGAAKRFMLWTNEEREKHGLHHENGFTILRVQTVTRTPYRDVKGAELDAIDEGRRPNG